MANRMLKAASLSARARFAPTQVPSDPFGVQITTIKLRLARARRLAYYGLTPPFAPTSISDTEPSPTPDTKEIARRRGPHESFYHEIHNASQSTAPPGLTGPLREHLSQRLGRSGNTHLPIILSDKALMALSI